MPLAPRIVTVLFVAAMAVFAALGTTLVVLQGVGIVLMRPGLVAGASDALLVPAIASAVVFGLIAFVGSYLVQKHPAPADDSATTSS